MPADRRDFLRLAGASAGTLLLAGCGESLSSPGSSTDSVAKVTAGATTSAPPAAAAPASTSSATLADLQSFLQSHASPTFDLPAAPASPPVISWAGPLGNTVPTTLPNGAVYALSSANFNGPIRNDLAASLPGSPGVGGDPCLQLSAPYTCKGQPRLRTSPLVLRFKTDAPVFELAGVGADNSPNGLVQTLIVDGELVPPKVLSCSRGQGGWEGAAVRVDFGSRVVRDIWIQTDLYAAYLKVGPDDTVFPVDDQAEPQITAIGDSYLQRQSNNFGGGAIAMEIGARLGIRNVAIDSIGGTGYYDSGGDLGNFNDRLPADTPDNSAIYLVMGGLNDYNDITASGTVTPPLATYEATVLTFFQGLRAAQPNAVIVVTAPFCPNPTLSDSYYPNSSPTAVGGFQFKAQVQKSSLQQIAGPWVYIDVLMGGGWLNSSGATGDITNLQWFTGGTAAPGTTATNKPGNTSGGGGAGFGGIAGIQVLAGGKYSQAPEITATGGAGSGLLLAASIDGNGVLQNIGIVSPGVGYTSGSGLPTITIDPTFQLSPATLAAPTLMVGINPNGAYPLPAFAPPGTSGELNNIYVMLMPDETHPSPVGVSYLSSRLAQNIFDGIMAL
jgi:hypothetical protein